MGHITRAARTLALVSLASWLPLAPVGAQRRGGTTSPAKPSTNLTEVRTELAAVLLQSGKYADAAREYRALLSRDSTNFSYRLGLARALAWGGQSRDAERELRVLQSRHLEIPTIDSLLRSVRDAMEPTSAEAAPWVAERPDYGPYRVALARALAKERRGRAAGAQYDTLLMGISLGRMPDPNVLRRERARSYLDAGDLAGGSASLRDLLRWTPSDTAARHELAVILVNGKSTAAGRAQYDTLIAAAPTAALFTERGRLRLALADTNGAERDMLAALPLGGTATAFVTLGDLYRERGDDGPARSMYTLAVAKLGNDRPNRLAVQASIAQLAREDRPVVAFVPTVGDDPGWSVSSDGAGDNLGVHYAASTLRGTAPLGDAARAGIAVIHNYLGERSDERSIDFSLVGAEGLLSSEAGYGPVLGRAAVEGGALRLAGTKSLAVASASVAALLMTWEAAFVASTGPAYPSLLTTTAVEPLAGGVDVIIERSATESIGGPIGTLDVAGMAQQTHLSDGNRRTTEQAYARLPLMPGFSLVYSGTRVAFSERSTRYWDPIDYTAHGAGVELGTRAARGLSATARVLPGIAWSVEAAPAPTGRGRTSRPPDDVHRSAFQLSGGGDVRWRDPHWELDAAATYGQGRTGDYRRLGVSLGVRVMP
ncbi:MAG: tetratricopeptide repeat protein [Gemmatimonadaceae bacterium]